MFNGRDDVHGYHKNIIKKSNDSTAAPWTEKDIGSQLF